MKSSTGGNAASAPRWAPARIADLRARILSALVLIPITLLAVWVGGPVFLAFIALGAVLSVHEWVRIVEHAGLSPAAVAAYASVVAALGVDAAFGPLAAMAAATALGALVAALAGPRDRWIVGFGVPYVAAGGVSLVWLRDAPGEGIGLIVLLLITVWACDIGAYVAGRALGGPRLAPRISPQKTWAGLAGGVLLAGLAAVAAVAVLDPAHPLGSAFLFGGVVALVSQGGDLFESAVKRRYNVKDSGHLIPGHGGLLDRIDGLMAAAPVLALYYAAFGTSHA